MELHLKTKNFVSVAFVVKYFDSILKILKVLYCKLNKLFRRISCSFIFSCIVGSLDLFSLISLWEFFL